MDKSHNHRNGKKLQDKEGIFHDQNPKKCESELNIGCKLNENKVKRLLANLYLRESSFSMWVKKTFQA